MEEQETILIPSTSDPDVVYVVSVFGGSQGTVYHCTCPQSRYRPHAGQCKHVRIAASYRLIRAWNQPKG
jgi:hypothetical protein